MECGKVTLLGLHRGPTPKLTSAGPVPASWTYIETHACKEWQTPRSAPPPQAYDSRPEVTKGHPKLLTESGCEETFADQLVSALSAILKKESLTVSSVASVALQRLLGAREPQRYALRIELPGHHALGYKYRPSFYHLLAFFRKCNCSAETETETETEAEAEAEAVHTISEISFLITFTSFSLLALQQLLSYTRFEYLSGTAIHGDIFIILDLPCFHLALSFRSSVSSLGKKRKEKEKASPCRRGRDIVYRSTTSIILYFIVTYYVSTMPRAPRAAPAQSSHHHPAPYPRSANDSRRSSPNEQRAPASAWSDSDDNKLIQARHQGLAWQRIATKYFPSKSPNACRKRHERLQERLKVEQWDGVKVEDVAKAYVEVREEMWKILASKVEGGKWKVVEAKVRNRLRQR